MIHPLKPVEFKTGELDNSGTKICRIYTNTPDYVVYRAETSIRIYIDDASPRAKELSGKHKRISADIAKVYSLLPVNLETTEPINRQIARAIDMNIGDGDHTEAKLLLANAYDRLKKLKIISGRLCYSLTGLFAFFIFMVASYLVSQYPILLPTAPDGVLLLLMKVAVCGSMGGCLSVFSGLKTIEIDVDAPPLTNCLIGGSRILIAIIAAILSFLLVKSGIAFGTFNTPDNLWGIYTLAALSGFSEKLIPKIMDGHNTSTTS